MKPKPKIACPVCNLVLALNTNGLIPRHRPRWREGPNAMGKPVCFASYKTPRDAQTAAAKFELAS